MSNNVEYTISLRDKNFSSGIDEANGKVNGLEGSLKNIGPIVAGALAGIGISNFVSGVVETISTFEKFEAVLTNTLGSGSEAQKSMHMLTDFAAKTPFDVEQLTGSFVKLANMGFKPTEEQLRNIGDLAASVGKPFDQLSEAIIDAQTGEFERLKEFGVKASKTGDLVTFMFKNQKTTVANTSTAIQDYILSLGKLQGVENSMAAISKTTGGSISNLGDSYQALQLEIGQGLKPAITWTLDAMQGLIGFTRDLIKWGREHATVVKSIGVAIGLMAGGVLLYKTYVMAATLATEAWTMAQAILNGTMAINPIGAIIVGVGLLAGAIAYLWNTFEGFRGSIVGAWEMLKTFGGLIKDSLLNTLKGLGDIVTGIFTFDSAKINSGLKAVGKGMADAVTMGAYSAYKNKDKLADSFNKGYDKAKGMTWDNPLVSLADHTTSNNISNLPPVPPVPPTPPNGSPASKVSSVKPTSITINIDSLIKDFKIVTENLGMDKNKIAAEVSKLLMGVVNDTNKLAGI